VVVDDVMRTTQARAFLVILLMVAAVSWPASSPAVAEDTHSDRHEFSGVLIKEVNGKTFRAQVFAKKDRLRLEYTYALRTDFGYAAIEIIRLDQSQAWYVLAQQKELLVIPLDPDEILPLEAALPGERHRLLVGDATTAGRAAQLYEVESDHRGRIEHWYEWVDVETGIALQLVSRDHDWSFRYERIRWASQPGEYFDEPRGYKKRHVETIRKQQG
jgi:hypothetical protein